MNLSRPVLFFPLVVGLSLGAATAPPAVAPLDLSQHETTDTAQIRRVGPGEYEWRLPDGLTQSISLDLNALHIDPAAFDELRFDIRPEGSLVFLQTVIRGFPGPDQVSSWYSKFNMSVGHWTEGRYDLRLDDDGAYLHLFGTSLANEPVGRLRLTLSRQALGLPGEPSWRTARLRNPRFVRYPVSASFRLDECVMETDGAEVVYTYPLHLRNRTDTAQTVQIEPDSARTLRYFTVTAATEATLAPGEARDVPVRLAIPRTQALRLPALYAEPLLPKVTVPGLPDSDVVPIMGYRPWPMWGVIPVFNRVAWTPATMQAFVAAREATLPGTADWRQRVVALADRAMPHEWAMPKDMLPLHPAGYRCPDKTCRATLDPAEPMALHQHVCPKCKTAYENVETLDRAGLFYYYGRRTRAVRDCALAWLLTGEAAYARKAADLLLALADAYPSLPIYNERTAAGATKLGFNSLMASYQLPTLAEGYRFLAADPDLDADQCRRIEAALTAEALRIARHSVQYSNMTAEHFRAYGTAAIATGFWPLAGEAIYGEFGWHEVVERGYSEAGIAQEAGAYHRAVFHAMEAFASFAWSQNVNLYTARFKRVFDGSLTVGGDLAAVSYETAYAVYRDPAYLGILEKTRSGAASEPAILHGVPGLPRAEQIPVLSAHLPSDGYIFLRKGNAADSYEVRLSYIKFWDRTEHDRFATFFRRNGQPVETMPGRMSYGDVNSAFMYATAAHNAIVIDGGDQRFADGRLIAYTPDPDTPLAAVATDPAAPLYDGVQQLRAIALIENNYIVFDAVRADRPCVIDRYQYGRGEPVTAGALAPAPPDFPGLPHPEFAPIKNVEAGAAGRSTQIRFKDDCTLSLVSEQEFQLCRGLTHGGYRGQPMAVTFARVAAAREASFLAAFTWGNDPPPPQLRIVTNTPTAAELEVRTAARTYVIRIEPPRNTATITARNP